MLGTGMVYGLQKTAATMQTGSQPNFYQLQAS